MLPLLLFAAAARAADRPPYPPKLLAQARDVSAVASSPDGKTVYFADDITGAAELWRVPAAGGWPDQLSALGEQVTEPAVSPDGKMIAFASDYGGDERADLFLVPAAGGAAVNVTSSTRAEMSPAFSPDGKSLAFLAEAGTPFRYQLFVMDLATRKERRLTDEKEKLMSPRWSPDGKRIAAVLSGDERAGPLLIAAADGSGVARFPPPVKDGIMIPQDWSPDGRFLLAAAEDADGFHRLYLLDTESGKGRFIGPGGWNVERAEWRRNGIFFARNEGGVSALYLLPKKKPLLRPHGRIDSFDADEKGETVFFIWSDSARAQDVWRLDVRTKALTQVTHSMPPGVADLSTGTIIAYPSFDGALIRATYIPPRAPRLGTPPPLVVDVHGGPDLQSFDDFSALRQSLAEAGFAVLAPNYRGSDGFGRKFLDANHKDWGGADRKDMIAGAKFLAARGEADPGRAGIMGLSYGGYSALYALARNEGEWAAGVDACGMPDLVADYDVSVDRFDPWYQRMMGNPKDDGPLFRERSAINYLDRMTAPLLIFQGANDTNVPLAESRTVYDALKKLGRDVALVVYPDEGHGFTRRKNNTDYYERTVEFFKAKMPIRPDPRTR